MARDQFAHLITTKSSRVPGGDARPAVWWKGGNVCFSNGFERFSGMACPDRGALSDQQFGGKEEMFIFPMVFNDFRIWSARAGERPPGEGRAPMVPTGAPCENIDFTKVFRWFLLGKHASGPGWAGPPVRVPVWWKAGNACFCNVFQCF